MFTVTDVSDSATDTGSLRYALTHLATGAAANTNTITFASNLDGQTITETAAGGGGLTINQGVTINGSVFIAQPLVPGTPTITGPTGITIDGGGAFAVFTVNSGISVSLTDLTIAHGGNAFDGGAIDNRGTLTVSDSTFSGNSAVNGGAIANDGSLTISNSTFFGNSASGGGSGGIFNFVTTDIFGGSKTTSPGILTVSDSTFSGNSAGNGGTGGAILNSGTATLNGDILVGNTSSGNQDDLDNDGGGTITGSNNVVGKDNSGDLSGANNLLNQTVAQVALAPLGNYGGPTQTFALLPGSVAIGMGQTGMDSTDQRGAPRSATARADAGAFQDQGYTLTAANTPQSANVNTVYAQPLVATLTEKFANSPLPGATLTFTAPSNGASASFVSTAVTNAIGQASVTATANGTVGNFTVTASDAGMQTATFTLTNLSSAPPFVSVAFGPFGEVLEEVNSAGVLTRFDATGAHVLGGGVRSASVAFGPGGEVDVLVGADGFLTQIDAAGVHRVGGGVLSANLAFGPQGEVVELVTTSGMLFQISAAGTVPVASGVVSASVTFGPFGQVFEVVTQGGGLVQFDAAHPQGVIVAASGVQSAGAAYAGNSLVLDIIFSDGTLDQFDAFGIHPLGMVT